MSKVFTGTINVDIRDSVPDWAPFEPPKAPEGAPSVVCTSCSPTPASPPGARSPSRQ
jgi:hypothetical protein